MNSLNICGAGPSGSTLLGLMAGSHSACVHLGEAARIKSFDKADWPEQKRACQICGPACATCIGFAWLSRPATDALSSIRGFGSTPPGATAPKSTSNCTHPGRSTSTSATHSPRDPSGGPQG